jgi:hypothetical protein
MLWLNAQNKKHLREQVLMQDGILFARKQGHDSEAVARFSEYCSKKSPPCQSEEVVNMLTKYDVTDLDRNSLPDEVQHEVHEYEGMGRELVSIKVYNYPDDDDINEETWHLVFYEPFFSFESSEHDNFSFVDVCYQKWPTDAVHSYYHNITRGEMMEALKHESKKQKEVVA